MDRAGRAVWLRPLTNLTFYFPKVTRRTIILPIDLILCFTVQKHTSVMRQFKQWHNSCNLKGKGGINKILTKQTHPKVQVTLNMNVKLKNK